MSYIIAKLVDICTITKGITGIMKAVDGEYTMVGLGKKDKTNNEYQFDAKAVIIPLISSTGHGSATMKRVKYVEGKFALGTILCAVIPKDESKVSAKYLHIYLHKQRHDLLVPLMKGAANVTLPIKRLYDVEIPLPDIKEQIRIVEFDKVISEKNDVILAEIALQKEYVAKLKQSILQDAISGKLTEEWRTNNPNTEPASELLKRIKKEKQQLIKDGKIRKEKPLAPIVEDEIPFEIPSTWQWCRLSDLCSKTGSGSTPKGGKSVYPTSGIYFLRSQNVHNNGITLDGIVYISESTHKTMSGTIIKPNDILLNITGGSIGRCAIVSHEIETANINQHVAIIRLMDNAMNTYIHSVIISDYFQKTIESVQTGAGREGLPKNKMDNILIPIPPIEEIQHIALLINTKTTWCKDIENQIKLMVMSASKLSKTILTETLKIKC